MKFPVLLLCVLVILISNSIEVEYRAIDAYGNNLENPTWVIPGSANLIEPKNSYSDGIGKMNQNLPNPRTISNTLFSAQQIADPLLLNDLHVFFAQFVCHDFQIENVNPLEPSNIAVPAGDPWFDPFNEGDKELLFDRIIYHESTGVSTPRQSVNWNTGVVDGSQIYGSNNETATALRNETHPEYLKIAISNNGEIILPQNNFGLVMDNNAHRYPDIDLFAAGDVRANENCLLTVFHTLFVREHNRLVDQFKAEHPKWDSEKLYQEARRWNIAYYQAIVFGEYVPVTIGRPLPVWTAYNSSLNPQPSNLFIGAAFRYGHSETNTAQQRISADGAILEPVLVRDSYFNPIPIRTGGIENFLRGALYQVQQNVDTVYVDDIRNLLFGFPGNGGNDLASININRGRDKGLMLYNDAREYYSLPRVSSFSEVTNFTEVVDNLNLLYGNPDFCDPYVCGLAEDRYGLSSVGSMFGKAIEEQYIRFRDGDRFYFQNADAGFTEDEILAISQTTISSIITRNTNITEFPCSAFYVPANNNFDCNRNVDGNATNSNTTATFLNGDYVLDWVITGDSITFTLTVQTEGWAGFGLARDAGSMLNSDAMIGYVDGATAAVDDYDISERSEGCPGVCPDTSQGGRDDVTGVTGTESGGVTVLTWTRKLDTGDSSDVAIVEGQSNAVIYAMADGSSDSISYHGSKKGAGDINFFTGESTTTAIVVDSGPSDRLIIHGVFMFFAWAVLFPLGIFVVRFCKRILLKWWFRLHMLIQYLAVLFIIVALILAVEAVAKGGIYKHVHSAHAILGVISVCLSIITPALGQITSLLWANTRKSVPIFPDRVHFIIGYLSPIVAYVTIFFGLERKECAWWWYLLVALWIAFTTILFFVLLVIQFIYENVRKAKNRKAAANAQAANNNDPDDDEDWDDE